MLLDRNPIDATKDGSLALALNPTPTPILAVAIVRFIGSWPSAPGSDLALAICLCLTRTLTLAAIVGTQNPTLTPVNEPREGCAQ